MPKISTYANGGRIQKTDRFVIARPGVNRSILGDKIEAYPYGSDVSSEASSATPTIDVDLVEIHRITALAVAITSFTTNLTGTPRHGQKLLIEITDNGVAKAITWGAKFRDFAMALPTTTVAGKLQRTLLIYNDVGAVWDCLATADLP